MSTVSVISDFLDKSKFHKGLIFLVAILGAFFGIMLSIFNFMKTYDMPIYDISIISTISITIIFTLALIFRFILIYLDGKTETPIISGQDLVNSALGYDTTLDENSREELVQQIKAKIQKEAMDSYIDELRSNLKLKDSIEYSKFQSSQTLARIQRAILAQNAKANFNLAIGVVTAIIGVALLIFFIPNYNSDVFDLSQFLITLLPRLSVVVLIETFAYFFLRMYKYNLNEIKYFQNEATSIEHRLQALNIAIYLDDKEILKTILLTFSEMDKNKEQQQIIKEEMPLSLDYLVKIAEVLKDKKD